MAETTKTYTERDIIVRERVAFRWGWNGATSDRDLPHSRQRQREEQMASRYPLAKVESPRVIADPLSPAVEWRARLERSRWRIEVHYPGCFWEFYPREKESVYPTEERLKVWAELLANPCEFVEDDGSAAASPEGR